MPKDIKDDYTFNDDAASQDDMPKEDDVSEEETEEELSEDVKEALGLEEDGPVKPINLNPKEKGKKPVKEVTPISDWLPADDARALEHIDSLY